MKRFFEKENDPSNEGMNSTLDVEKKEFNDFILDLLIKLEDIDYNFLISSPPMHFNIYIEEKNDTQKFEISTLPKIKDYIMKQLSFKIEYIIRKYSSTVLDEFFDLLINIIIQKKKEKYKFYFISLEDIFKIFSRYGMRMMPIKTVDNLLGGLQWNVISPEWLNYSFLLDYYNNLSFDISTNYKKKIWILLNLTRIKSEELKFKQKSINNFI